MPVVRSSPPRMGALTAINFLLHFTRLLLKSYTGLKYLVFSYNCFQFLNLSKVKKYIFTVHRVPSSLYSEFLVKIAAVSRRPG